MTSNPLVMAVYGLLLFAILAVNVLYFFQIFRFRLPGDASAFIVIGHVLILAFILIVGGIFISI